MFHYKDPRIDAALWSLREAELLQAVYRLRPLSRNEPCKIVILTEQPIPGLPVHLTGLGGVFCPEWHSQTSAVLDATAKALVHAFQEGRTSIETGDVAQLAFNDRTRSSRAKVTKGSRLDEIAYHLRLNVEQGQGQSCRPLNNGGTSRYDVWTIQAKPV